MEPLASAEVRLPEGMSGEMAEVVLKGGYVTIEVEVEVEVEEGEGGEGEEGEAAAPPAAEGEGEAGAEGEEGEEGAGGGDSDDEALEGRARGKAKDARLSLVMNEDQIHEMMNSDAHRALRQATAGLPCVKSKKFEIGALLGKITNKEAQRRAKPPPPQTHGGARHLPSNSRYHRTRHEGCN